MESKKDLLTILFGNFVTYEADDDRDTHIEIQTLEATLRVDITKVDAIEVAEQLLNIFDSYVIPSLFRGLITYSTPTTIDATIDAVKESFK